VNIKGVIRNVAETGNTWDDQFLGKNISFEVVSEPMHAKIRIVRGMRHAA
jgi:hypothetical protein